MYRNTVTTLSFDTNKILTDFDGNDITVSDIFSLKDRIGHSLSEILASLSGDKKQVFARIADSVHEAASERRVVYSESDLAIRENESAFIIIISSPHNDGFKVMCIRADENDIYSNRWHYSTDLIKSSLSNAPVGIVIRKRNTHHNQDFFISNLRARQLLDCDSPELTDCQNWNTKTDEGYDQQAIKNGGTLEFQKLIKNPDGSIKRWLSVSKQFSHRGDTGSIMVTTIVDFTEQKKSEIKSLESLNMLHLVVESTNSIIFTLDTSTNDLFVFGDDGNSDFKMMKFKKEEFDDVVHPDDREEYYEKIRQLYAGEIKVVSMEVREKLPRFDDYRYFSETISCSTNIDGHLVITGIRMDINERKLQQLEHEKLVAINASLFENMPVGVEIYDTEGCLVTVNEKELEHFGLTRDTVPVGKSIFTIPFLTDDDKQKIRNHEKFTMVMEYDFDVINSKQVYSSLKKGTRFFDIRFTPMYTPKGEFLGYISVNMDVTESHMQQRKLEEISANLDLALMAGEVSAWIYYPDRRWFDSLKGDALAGAGISMDDNQKILHPDDIEMQEQLFDDIVNFRKKQGDVVFRYRNANGSYNHYESKMMPNVVNGKVVSITGTQRDITDRIRAKSKMENLVSELKNTNEILSLIVSNLPCALTIKDASDDFKFVTVNKVFCQIFGQDPNKIEGNNRLNNLAQDTFDEFSQFDKEAAESMTTITHESEVHLVNGDSYNWLVTRSPIKMNNGHTFLINIYSDVTQFRRAHNELEKAKIKAEEADQLKSAFLANMSHEIRTPLNAIVGFSEMLQYAESAEEREQYVQAINNNNEMLLRLINDILDLSKIEAGYINIHNEEFDVSKVLAEAAANAKCQLAGKNVSVVLDNPYSVCLANFDKQRFSQILNNFLANAVKYTRAGSIQLSVECEIGQLKVSVKDTGIGVSEEKQKLLFSRFNKLDEFAQGTGLGLAICKAITDTIGGRVGFESSEGVGSTFWAIIPCDVKWTVKELSSPSSLSNKFTIFPEAPLSAQTTPSILVAEDNDSNFMLLKAILKEYRVVRALNGDEAVRIMQNADIDLVLMDLRMPIMNGLEATREIRKFDNNTPIVAVTANAFDSDRQDARDAGCNDFLPKPIKRLQLLELVEQYISKP